MPSSVPAVVPSSRWTFAIRIWAPSNGKFRETRFLQRKHCYQGKRRSCDMSGSRRYSRERAELKDTRVDKATDILARIRYFRETFFRDTRHENFAQTRDLSRSSDLNKRENDSSVIGYQFNNLSTITADCLVAIWENLLFLSLPHRIEKDKGEKEQKKKREKHRVIASRAASFEGIALALTLRSRADKVKGAMQSKGRNGTHPRDIRKSANARWIRRLGRVLSLPRAFPVERLIATRPSRLFLPFSLPPPRWRGRLYPPAVFSARFPPLRTESRREAAAPSGEPLGARLFRGSRGWNRFVSRSCLEFARDSRRLRVGGPRAGRSGVTSANNEKC